MKAQQIDTIRFIRDYQEDHRYPPTLQEIAVHLGVSVKRAHTIVKKLVEEGHLTHKPNQARTITVVSAMPG